MKRIVALALCLVMVLGLMTGCQKAMDAKTVYQKMTEAGKSVTATGMDAEMDLEMKMSTMGMTMTMGADVDMTMQAKADLSAMYMEMNMTMEALGQTEEMKMEMYGTMEDGALVCYAYESTEDIWVKTTQSDYAELMGELTGMEQGFSTGNPGNLTLAKQQETVGDRKCYVLTETIDGAAIQEEMGDYMTEMLPQMTGGEELDEESMAQIEAVMKELDWSKLSGTVVYYVDAETFHCQQMSMEILGLGDVFNSMIEPLMAEAAAEYESEEIPEFSIEIPTFKIIMKNVTYNDDVQVPAVPQEAIDNAIDADAIVDDTIVDNEYTDVTGIAPLEDGSYQLTLGSNTIRVMIPEGYSVIVAEEDVIVAMNEDMTNTIGYMLMLETTGEQMLSDAMDSVTWAQEDNYYKSHTEVAEVDGFQTMSLIYNDNTSSWNAWQEMDGGVLVLTAEVEGETFDLSTLIASVEIAAE